jgi:hypothetical protein
LRDIRLILVVIPAKAGGPDPVRHPSERGDPFLGLFTWIPDFAGMTNECQLVG